MVPGIWLRLDSLLPGWLLCLSGKLVLDVEALVLHHVNLSTELIMCLRYVMSDFHLAGWSKWNKAEAPMSFVTKLWNACVVFGISS